MVTGNKKEGEREKKNKVMLGKKEQDYSGGNLETKDMIPSPSQKLAF